eukprot:9863944-Alexandrium_andersonii.AAC.1
MCWRTERKRPTFAASSRVRRLFRLASLTSASWVYSSWRRLARSSAAASTESRCAWRMALRSSTDGISR